MDRRISEENDDLCLDKKFKWLAMMKNTKNRLFFAYVVEKLTPVMINCFDHQTGHQLNSYNLETNWHSRRLLPTQAV